MPKEGEDITGEGDVPVTRHEKMVSLLNVYSSIGNLYKEFIRAARLYAKIIISEVT